jgi:LCP family protein required for cell wall assembly
MGLNLSGTIWSTWTGNFEENVEAVEDVDYLDEEDLASDAEEIDPNTIIWPDHPGDGKHVEGVYNILLLGEEAIGSGDGRGRTDVIVIATMNTNTNKLMLTSLMRDTLVQIPGYKDNKLNTAYERGGLDLMYETIALNYDIQLDGCVKVNFENFEKIIDKLGGLELTLTAGEARYLNSTNYISKPQYRNVVEGKQLMNGNQVLGYSRVRKRATITGNNNDYGRTDRHRIVLNAIFDKYKTKSKVELASMMLNVLPMITTDIDSKNFELLLNNFIEMGTMEMSQLRIPADGTFTDNVKVRGMDVLIPDLQENAKILHDFVFGEEIKSVPMDGGVVTEETKSVTATDTSSGN